MKKLFTIILMLVATITFAQKKEEPKTAKIDTISIQIPARQMQKLVEINRMQKELEAKREDILLDILAVPENVAKIEGANFSGIKEDKIKFVKIVKNKE